MARSFFVATCLLDPERPGPGSGRTPSGLRRGTAPSASPFSPLVAFQRDAGLGADGIWGPMTQAAVLRALG